MITSIFAGIGILFCALIVIAFIGKILHLTVSDKDLYDKLVVVDSKLDKVLNRDDNNGIQYVPCDWHAIPCTGTVSTITATDVDKVQSDNKVVC